MSSEVIPGLPMGSSMVDAEGIVASCIIRPSMVVGQLQWLAKGIVQIGSVKWQRVEFLSCTKEGYFGRTSEKL